MVEGWNYIGGGWVDIGHSFGRTHGLQHPGGWGGLTDYVHKYMYACMNGSLC